jgi:phosphatidate phosphatase PAH1
LIAEEGRKYENTVRKHHSSIRLQARLQNKSHTSTSITVDLSSGNGVSSLNNNNNDDTDQRFIQNKMKEHVMHDARRINSVMKLKHRSQQSIRKRLNERKLLSQYLKENVEEKGEVST